MCLYVGITKYPEYKSKICAKGVFRSARHKNIKNLLEKGNNCDIICVGYNCNALQFWSGRKLFGPP